jgi:hypothetical protein
MTTKVDGALKYARTEVAATVVSVGNIDTLKPLLLARYYWTDVELIRLLRHSRKSTIRACKNYSRTSNCVNA